MRFPKCLFSTWGKRSKIFPSALAFSYRFHLSTLKRLKTMKTIGTYDCARVNITRPSAILDRYPNLDWNRWHVTLFTSPFSKVFVFTSPHLKRSVFKTTRFEKSPLLKPFSKLSVLMGVFGRFSVDDRQKRRGPGDDLTKK